MQRRSSARGLEAHITQRMEYGDHWLVYARVDQGGLPEAWGLKQLALAEALHPGGSAGPPVAQHEQPVELHRADGGHRRPAQPRASSCILRCSQISTTLPLA